MHLVINLKWLLCDLYNHLWPYAAGLHAVPGAPPSVCVTHIYLCDLRVYPGRNLSGELRRRAWSLKTGLIGLEDTYCVHLIRVNVRGWPHGYDAELEFIREVKFCFRRLLILHLQFVFSFVENNIQKLFNFTFVRKIWIWNKSYINEL